ncbi:MAG: autotransporter-associated beta strand repeat-containing protein [Planctomycetota bacterium]|nr:autotransporter-associated beta strand repeat-containing protein [Planctomycetota bacterium]
MQAVAEGALTTISTTGTFNVFLPNLLNDFITLTISSNDVLVADANDLRVVASSINGDLAVATGLTTILSNNNIQGSTDIDAGLDIIGGGNTFSGAAYFNATRYIALDDAPNTFGGDTFLGGQQVVVDAQGDLVLDGGNAAILLDITATGSISQAPGNYLNVSGNSSFTAGGTVNINNPLNILAGAIDASGTDITLVNDGPVILDTITATGNLTVSGAGISQTGTINAPTGLATLSAGAGNMVLGGQNSLGTVILSGNNITLKSLDSVVLEGLNASGNVNLSSGGSLSQTIPITINGTSLFNAAKHIRLGNAENSLGQAVSANANGLVDIRATGNLTTGSITTSQDAVLQAQNNLYVQGEIRAVTTSLAGGGVGTILAGPVYGTTLNWDGAGSMELAGAQHYTSDFLINKGRARVLGNNILPKDANLHVLQDALFSTDAHVTTIKGLYGAGEVSLGTLTPGELIINNPVDALFSGVISGTGPIEKTGAGTQIFTGNNTFTGGTTIRGGTLQLGNQINNGGLASDVNIENGTLSFQPGSNTTFANAILSEGTDYSNQFVELRAPAGVVLTLSGANQFQGTTTIFAGSLDIQSIIGDVILNGPNTILTGSGTIDGLSALQGVVAPGNLQGTGTLTVLGDAAFFANSTLHIGIKDNNTFGVLKVSDDAILGLLGAPSQGSLEVTVDPSYLPLDLQTYKILTANPVLNRFAQGTVIISGDYYFRAIYSQDNVVLQKVPAGVLPGASPLIVSPGAGQSNAVIYNSSNAERARIQPMGSWTGGMRSSVGDVTGDGWADYIFAAAPGGGPRIVVVDGVSLQNVSSFYAYSSTFHGGVYVASGDINGDGLAEIVTGAGATGGPHVQSFNVNGTKVSTGFYAYAKTFTGGVTVATGDLDGDGIDEIITGAASNGGAHVRSFNASGVLGTLNFFAYAESFQGGVNVGAGDINGDGLADVITGPGPSGSPNVKFFDSNGDQLTSFYAYLQDFAGGVSVGVIDPTNTGTFSVVTGPGNPSAYYPGPRVNLYTWDPPTAKFLTNFLAYPNGFDGGIWVA